MRSPRRLAPSVARFALRTPMPPRTRDAPGERKPVPGTGATAHRAGHRLRARARWSKRIPRGVLRRPAPPRRPVRQMCRPAPSIVLLPSPPHRPPVRERMDGVFFAATKSNSCWIYRKSGSTVATVKFSKLRALTLTLVSDRQLCCVFRFHSAFIASRPDAA